MGEITFIVSSAPWVKFLLSQVYISIAAGDCDNEANLVCTNKQFCQLLKDAKEIAGAGHTQTSTFALSESSRQVHSCNRKHLISKSREEEVHLIIKAVSNKRLKL